MEGLTQQQKPFETLEQELAYLRAQVATKEKLLHGEGKEVKSEQVIADAIKDYRYNAPAEVLATNYALGAKEQEAIVLDLAPEEHDVKIEELLGLLQTKGIHNTLSVVEKMKDPHLEDDLHRFLVQYVKAGFPVEGLSQKSDLFRALRMTLYEITLPDPVIKEGETKEVATELKRFISAMEQFYAGMLSVSSVDEGYRNHFTLEIANANGSAEFVFYASVPDAKRELFEKQILALFSSAKVREAKDDYNIFNESGVAVGSVASLQKMGIFPLKQYDEFDIDPLNVILNSFSKIDKDGEGAAVQFLFKPSDKPYVTKYKEALRQIESGTPVFRALDIPMSLGGDLFKGLKDVLRSPDKRRPDEKPPVDTVVVEHIKKKIASPIILSSVRVVASAKTEPEAVEILSHIEASFNQFENATSNRLLFTRLQKSALKKLLQSFSWRTFDEHEALPLSIKELTTLMHFPAAPITGTAQLKQAKAGTAPAPLDLPREGITLGVNRYRGGEFPIKVTAEDRLRHFYVIGQTGTGKTTLLKNMIAQDIANGDGVCMIDPHGADIQDILGVIPKHRYEDVIYFDPSHIDRPMALNMLEYDARFPEQKTFVVNEMLSIFNKLFDMKTSGGPMFEQYFRNSVLLTIEDPESGSTLLDVSRVLSNKEFRAMKLARCKNPIVVQFWTEVAEKAGGEASLQNIVPYVVSKFDNFLANDIMRPIIAQQKSSFNFREIMDERKILLVNLAKGRLGDINSHLIGLILVGKILMAALSRVDSFGKDMPPFYLYIDEFQNITTPSISTILSEARKYKLSLNVAHQFIAQLEDDIRDAVFGNVGSLSVFRVGSEDAEFLEKQFAPVFTASDIMNLDNRNAYMKLLLGGKPGKPFNMETLPPPPKTGVPIEKLKELSYLKYGRDRMDVEEEIMKKYNTNR